MYSITRKLEQPKLVGLLLTSLCRKVIYAMTVFDLFHNEEIVVCLAGISIKTNKRIHLLWRMLPKWTTEEGM